MIYVQKEGPSINEGSDLRHNLYKAIKNISKCLSSRDNSSTSNTKSMGQMLQPEYDTESNKKHWE